MIVKYSKQPSDWFTIWTSNDGSVVCPYHGEKKPSIAMKRYIDDTFIPDARDNIIAQEDGLFLDTTKTTHDSISVAKDKVWTNLLELLNDKETTNQRTYTFTNSAAVYETEKDLKPTTAGKFDIVGYDAGDNKSTIDFDSKKAIELSNAT
jgi:hypothetical protein